jgi:hypothetical protein
MHPDPRFPESEPETGLKNAIYFFLNSLKGRSGPRRILQPFKELLEY